MDDIDCTHHLCDVCEQHIPADKWMPGCNGHSHHYGSQIWAEKSIDSDRFDRIDCRVETLPTRDPILVMVARWLLGKSRSDSLKQYRQVLFNKQY